MAAPGRGAVGMMAAMSEPAATPFVHSLRVRYAECDAQGVVFNAHYLAYMDHTITEMWRAAFGSYQAMIDRGLDVVVAAAELAFRVAARFDDVLTIEARVVHLGTTSVRIAYRMLREDELILAAETRHVFVIAGTNDKTPMPDWARAGLASWTTT